MYILGINGSANPVHENRYDVGEGNNHDSSAALLHNGEVLAIYEEERLNRIKHTNKWPCLAINACLDVAGITYDQVDYFTFNLTEKTLEKILWNYFSQLGMNPPSAHTFLQQLLQDQFQADISTDKVLLYNHHFAHAVTAFYPSQFEKALVVTIDGSGGEYSGTVYDGSGNDLKLLRTFSEEQSLGHFYNLVTNILGFSKNFDEYKVMGLAPYGSPGTYKELFSQMYRLLPEGNYELHKDFMVELMEICALGNSNKVFGQTYKDIAASLQEALETIVFHILKHYVQATGHKKLCLAGGVALNCTMNGKLLSSGLFEDIFVYPGANDSGLAVGSALAAYYEYERGAKRKTLHNMYVGSALENSDGIRQELDQWKQLVTYEELVDAPMKAAELLAQDKVIGWVQGNSEFAPRALGNRSILADPRPAKNKERINSMVKKREGFRPFAPSVMEEYVADFFELPTKRTEFSHMTFIFKVQQKYRELLGAITHVDGTARVQTVSKELNKKYWELIDHFRELTEVPIVLNTSFNNNAEPIVDSVRDALVSFLTTRLDFLIVGDFLVSRKEFFIGQTEVLYPALPDHIFWKNSDNTTPSLLTSFNEKVFTVTENLYAALKEADGKKNMRELLENVPVDEKGKERLLEELLQLWDKRVVILSPVPNVVTEMAI